MRRLALILLASICGVSAARAQIDSPPSAEQLQNWPQWRGPLGTGVAPNAGPPLQWSETKNVKWKIKVPGSGSSTPIVWGNKVFIHTAIPTGRKIEVAVQDEKAATPPPGTGGKKGMPRIAKPDEVHQFVLLCYDRRTGNELWRQVVREEVPHEGHHPDHGYASYSPATDGTCVISYFGSRGLHCYDMDGNPKWHKDLGQMQTALSFGEGSSPALFGNKVVVLWDHLGGDFIAAFDKNSGDELWRIPRDENRSTWSSPLIVPFDGQLQVVTSAINKIRSYNLDDGKLIWECGGLTSNAIPTPVPGDGMVYCTTGFQGSMMLAIRLGRTGDLTGTDAIAWKYDKDTPYVPTPLLYDGKLYFFKLNDSILTCLDAKTGTPVFGPQRLEGPRNVYASPVAADGRIYIVGRNGTTLVIRSGDKFEVLATNVLDDPIDASPAIVGSEMFLRGKEHLYCIAEK